MDGHPSRPTDNGRDLGQGKAKWSGVLGETAIRRSEKQGAGIGEGGLRGSMERFKEEEEERQFEKQDGGSGGYFSALRAACFGGSLPFQLVYLAFV